MKNLMHDVRASNHKGKTQPEWIEDSTWAQLLQVWDGEKFKSLSEINKKNRASTCDGKGYLRHIGGSITYLEHRRKLANKDGIRQWITPRAENIHEQLALL
ncbi:hypothetical protein ACH5RR_028981 [Cinchona calisaya]|uniref:Uncharacterized protein n=1 Tax=Cinchona calisaya TaxID=153742 RepID=A0ABD2YTY2_9GENT